MSSKTLMMSRTPSLSGLCRQFIEVTPAIN
eukprot:COSAG04_NODE_24981_length_314_cov_0.479070_1_plen_29_part_10